MSFTISKITPFPQNTLQFIPQNDSNEVVQSAWPVLGGILSEGKYVWHAKGSCLEVRNGKSGFKIGAWTFGCVLRDSNTKIVCVEEVDTSNGHLPLLAVGLDCSISGGSICIFDAGSSRVIRAIHVKERISNMNVVDSALEVLNLPGSLRCFDGILAVGTLGGDILLIDICRQICMDQEQVRDEISPCQIVIIPPHKVDKVERYKEQCIKEGNHLAIHLNIVLDTKTEHFTLKGPQNENKLFVNKEEVSVSKLYYCSQLTSLLVGFNFGAFQLWDLTTLSLIYTSPVCEDHLPITQFAFLEPTDDPRAFCYVWVAYSNTELYQGGFPFAVMYSFCYGSKEHHEGYGYLYQDFQFCTVRFQIELGVLHSTNKTKGGCILNFQPVYKQPNNKDSATKSTSDVLALTQISWTVWFDRGETQTNMLVFDLNQWYKEQMPSFSSWKESSTYILKTSLTEQILMSGHKPSLILNCRVITKSLNQFLGVQKLEEHFYPTALSFDVYVVRENDIIVVHSDSLQKALLSQIESAGPLCLVRTNDVYQQVINLGLTPLFVDLQVNTSTTIESQREIILNVGLEHHLTGWLCKCASEWANGSFSSAGCSLDFLLNWAFHRAVTLKTTCDRYCKSLFDYSQLPLDSNTSILLNSCTRQINNLCTFYAFVLGKLHNYLALPRVVEEQAASLDMVSIYFEVLVWMVNVGLLPECHQSVYPKDNSEKVNAPYPVVELTKYYNERRAQLRLLSKDTFASSDQLLFIDNLIAIKCGAEQLQKQWQDDKGSGLYPPPSLQSLLRSYLVPEANLLYKHTLVIYVFLDLAMTLDQTRYSGVITHLIKFPAVFKVPPSLIKITQAFWQLDHGDFASAMELMLDPQISNNDLQPWQHNVAMRALLLQEQNNLALFYMQVRKPPINSEKDILTAISLFVANNMLDEAFYFKNQHNSANIQILLQHLFRECNKSGSLQNLLYRRLDTKEEKAFFEYLKSINNPNFEDLQVFYYLLRARFIEAFDVHTNIKKRNPDSLGLSGQKNASVSDHVVKIFKKYLPDVSKNLVEYVRKERASVWTKLTRPTPLSVFVHDNNEQVQYKSTVIHAAISKAKSTFLDNKLNLSTEETPFLRTPVALRKKSRLATTIVTPHVIDYEEECPTPAKRLRLSPRGSTVSPLANQSMHSKMLTPIVKRNTCTDQESRLNATPHSILKVKSQDDPLSQTYDDLAIRNDSRIISLSCRMPTQNTPKKIQFDETTRFSTSLSDDSSLRIPVADSTGNESSICIEDRLIQEAEQKRLSSLSSVDASMMVSSKESSGTDSFYSPSSSLDEGARKGSSSVIKEPEQNVVEHAEMQVPRQDELKHDVDIDLHETKTMPQSPRARRSYKTLHDESSLLETRRTRASSVDKSLTESPRRTRTSSVDKSLIESPRRTRASSVDKSLIESPRRTRASSVERSEDVSMKDDAADDETKTLPQSSKARRSYKRSYDESAALEPRRTRASSVEKCRTESPSIEPRRTRASSVDKSIRISSVGASPAIRISSETSSSESPSTSVSESPKQSPRLLQVNRRKPLSRQVLEHNAFSALQSSKYVSKEVIVTKKDSTVITETSADSTKVISLEIESQVSEKISENQRSLRLTDSVRKEERIEHAEKNSEGDDSFLSQLADEWIKGRKVGKNCSDDESEVKDEVDTEENEPTDVTGSSTVDKNYLEANKNSGDNQSEVESDSIQLEFSTEESKPAGEVPSSTVDNNYLEARKKSGDNESEVEDKVDTEEIKPVDVMLSSAVDDDNPEESGQDEIEESTQLSEKESSDVAAQSKPTKLFAELEFSIPKVVEEHSPMEVDEDTPGFLSIVATEAVNYIIERRKAKESRPKIETIKEHTAEESGDGEEKPVQSVEVVEPAVIADTVLTELKPVYENTCYTVSDLDKGFLKSEVYADLSGSEDSCDRLEVVFETNIGNTAQIDPLEVSVRSSEIAKSQPEEESLNRAFIDVKESKVYQDLSSDSDNIEGDVDESRTQFDELEDCIFQSRSEREDDFVTERTRKAVDDVISISDSASSRSNSNRSKSSDSSENADKRVDDMEFHEEPEETMNIVKMDTSQVHSSLSKNNEAKSKSVTESQLKRDTNLASDETQGELTKSTGETEIPANVEYQSTTVSASKDVTASERPTTKSRSAEETEEEGSKNDNKESETDVGMSTSDERVATPSKARKLKRFEEHTSSSDTTDSDAVKEVVVTAEVHSPRSKKRTEEPLLKRVTRTNSTSLAQQEVDPKEQPSTSKQSEGKRSSRKTRSVSLTEEPVGSRRNLRSSSVETEGSVSEKKEENRAMPVDEGESTKKGRRRISSVDESTSTGGGRRGKRRTMSVDELPVIAEDVELGKKTTMDRYTSTRRLTRKQANMMRNSSIPEREEMEKLEEGEPFDPIDLLDKEPFQGKADSEEAKVYQGSSSTASTVSSVRPGKRITRSASAASDTSVAQVLTPKKQGRSKSQPKSPVQSTEGVKTRSRKYSDSNSVASIQSGSPSPPKRTRKKDDTALPSSTRKTTRSRNSSISSTKSDAHTKRK